MSPISWSIQFEVTFVITPEGVITDNVEEETTIPVCTINMLDVVNVVIEFVNTFPFSWISINPPVPLKPSPNTSTISRV